MRRFITILVAGMAAIALAAAPALAQGQGQSQAQSGERGGSAHPSGGQAVSRPAGNPGGAPPPTTSAPSGGMPATYGPPSAGRAGMSDRGPASSGRAIGRSGSFGPSRPAGTVREVGAAGSPAADGHTYELPQYARSRGSQPAIGTAVPRGNQPIVRGGDYYYYYPYGYYPYEYGYPYYGSLYLGWSYYNPAWWGYPTYGGGYGYGYGYSSASSQTDQGALRLKVKPRQAQVYVDGYFAGVVDQFDGIFQRLHLATGGHRIEIRLEGYKTLSFDVLIPPGETITYKGELLKLP